MGIDKRSTYLKFRRPVALLVLLIGATIAFMVTLIAGSPQQQPLLIFLFEGWVLSPFAALLVLIVLARKWKEGSQNTLYILTIVITLFSVVVYGGSGLITSYGTKPAFVFELVPMLSWMVIGIFLGIRFFNKEHAPRSPEGEDLR